MRYIKRKFETPVRPWDKQRLEAEREILKSYGLKNKRELWRVEGSIRKYRRLARLLAAKQNKEQEKLILDKLIKLGMLEEGAGLDDVLAITTQKLLDRRLQTVLQRKVLANTVKQARQMIAHGRVKIGERKIVYPSYIVSRDEENKITIISRKQTKVEKHGESSAANAGDTGNKAAAA